MTRASLFCAALVAALLCAPVGAQITATAFVDEQLDVPASVLDQLGEWLPSVPNADSALLTWALGPALRLTADSQVSAVYLANTTGKQHTLGYFTYTESPLTIVDRQLIFPRASGQALEVGARSVLRDVNGLPRTFSSGTKLGFFLVNEGWQSSQDVQNWSAATAQIPALDPALNQQVGEGLFTTLDALNPEFPHGSAELARHAVVLPLDGAPGLFAGEDLLALSFEDDNRESSSDNDFNDLALLLHAHEPGALGDGLPELPSASADSDLDGVPDQLDSFPGDPERAQVENVPSHGLNVIGLEDLYPADGDNDFNDTVLAYRFQLVKDAAGNLREVLGSFHLLARGGSFIHRLGLHVPGVPASAGGSVQVERFLEDDAQSHELDEPIAMSSFVLEHERRLDTLLPNSHFAIAPLSGAVFVNTQSEDVERPAASARVLLRFDTPVPPALLGAPPYDLYWEIFDGSRWVDVHKAGVDAFADHPADLPVEQGSDAFLDDQRLPWLLEVPYDFRFPVEHHSVRSAYPKFFQWAASKGTEAQDWAQFPAPDAKLSAPAEDYLVTRDWLLTLPQP
ncbi:MAG: hypothetical protein DHS20C15_23510 [Planctomycetota bacterium]|nr:MAG: hypothetical protein DHS20C15_23510 [Planctomycetota bacterium]